MFVGSSRNEHFNLRCSDTIYEQFLKLVVICVCIFTNLTDSNE